MWCMRNGIAWWSIATGIVIGTCLVSNAVAQETTTAAATAVDPKFEESIERRAGETVAEMKLTDAAKAERVKERFKQHFRDIQSWDVAHGKDRAETFNALRKDKENATLQAKLDGYNAQLQAMQSKFFEEMDAQLTPEQVELIKNRLIGGRYEHNLRGFQAEYDLPPEEWAKVVAMWQQARDEAMPLGTAAAKDQLFAIYKGKVNNYLSKQGYVGKSAAAKAAKAASQPAN
jgi:hypothetical protein